MMSAILTGLVQNGPRWIRSLLTAAALFTRMSSRPSLRSTVANRLRTASSSAWSQA